MKEYTALSKKGKASIVIPAAQGPQEGQGHHCAQGLGDHHGYPDPVLSQQQGQQEHQSSAKEKGAQEGDQCGDKAVAQGGKEG